MDATQQTIARQCLEGSYRVAMSFPESLRNLTEAGFEGYCVDYRTNTRTYYLSSGETLQLANPHPAGPVAARFDQPGVAAAIKWAQSAAPDYTYAAFNDRVTALGCAGYIVSLLGRRVLYFGRTAETHVEHFPQSP